MEGLYGVICQLPFLKAKPDTLRGIWLFGVGVYNRLKEVDHFLSVLPRR